MQRGAEVCVASSGSPWWFTRRVVGGRPMHRGMEADALWEGDRCVVVWRQMRCGVGADVSWGGVRGDVVCGMVTYIK